MKELINIYVVIRQGDYSPIDLVTTDQVLAFERCAERPDRSVEIWLGDKLTQTVPYDEVIKVGWVKKPKYYSMGFDQENKHNNPPPEDPRINPNDIATGGDMTDFNRSLSEQEIMDLYGGDG